MAIDEKAIFVAAMALPDAKEREAYLQEACAGHPELLSRLKELFSAHDESQGPLDRRPPALGVTLDAPVTERAGDIIGPYELLEQIGEGGMGTVWMAEQTEPVKRVVALKLIKAGMGSKQVIARFEAERQALALMDHANIARVLDAGTTSGGRPYFVMDLVKGVPITRFCDEHRLTPRQRLELFIPVCQAVQHAHQKGIIHRDLKPSNVLVALYDGNPAPKVIDFGVAKATGQALTEKSLVTGFGNIVGTLEYMSPEQAGTNQLDVDTRSDIYSLGVMLYELLAGSPPFRRNDLERAGILEILRVIREDEPSKPSTKLSTADGLPTLAANRGMEPKLLTRLLRGELDWIVMKSLEKDRNRRYETASAFALDVQRYLADEPVRACPPTKGYRFRKFVRRNRVVVLASTLVALALVIGIVGATVGLLQAEQARRDAVAAQLAEAAERRVAVEERAVARAVNEFLQQDLLLQADSYEQANQGFTADPNLTLKEALHRAAARIGDRFQDQPLVEAAIRQAIGDAYIGVGEYQRSLRQFERALALRKEKLGPGDLVSIKSIDGLASAYIHLDRPGDAVGLFEEAVRLRTEKLGPAHEDTVDSMIGLAITYRYLGRLPAAISRQEEALKLAKANLGPNHRLTISSMSSLALNYRYAGRLPEAIALQEEAMNLSKVNRGPRHPATFVNMGRLAMAYEASGRYTEAVALHQETLTLMKEHLTSDHPHVTTTMVGLVKAFRGARRLTEAVALQEEALKLLQAKRGPGDRYILREVFRLAELQTEQGRHDLAEPLLRQNLAILEKDQPNEWKTFDTKSLLGGALLGQKNYADAEPLLLGGYEGMKKHEATILAETGALVRLDEALERLVRLYDAWNKPAEAAKWRSEFEAKKAPKSPGEPKQK